MDSGTSQAAVPGSVAVPQHPPGPAGPRAEVPSPPSAMPPCAPCLMQLLHCTCWSFLLVLLPFLPLVELPVCLCSLLEPGNKHFDVIQGAVQDLL